MTATVGEVEIPVHRLQRDEEHSFLESHFFPLNQSYTPLPDLLSLFPVTSLFENLYPGIPLTSEPSYQHPPATLLIQKPSECRQAR